MSEILIDKVKITDYDGQVYYLKGEKGDTPVIGFATNANGDVYWTVNGNPLLLNGSIVRANGKDGEGFSGYTWIRYADDKLGTNFSDTPEKADHTYRKYIGFAYNKSTPTESLDYRDYTWTKYVGEGLKGDTGSQGIPGETGADGQTLYTWIKYSTANSFNEISNDNMTDDSTEDGVNFIGIATNKTSLEEIWDCSLYKWSAFRGSNGQNGITHYTWIRYADDAEGTNMSDSPIVDGVTKEYIGIANGKTSAIESEDPSDYEWFSFRGERGLKGENSYMWVKYSKGSTIPTTTSQMTDIPTVNTKYIGIATGKTTEIESDDPSDYIWSKFMGDDGVSSYTWIKYAHSMTPTSEEMFDTNPVDEYEYIGYAYNKTLPQSQGNPLLVNDYKTYTWSRLKAIDGTSRFISTVFKRQETQPDTPVGGTFDNPIPNGWFDGIPESGDSDKVWMSKRAFCYPETDTQWTEPALAFDSGSIDICYHAELSTGETPDISSLPELGTNPENYNGWHNVGNENDVWMAVSYKQANSSWSDWSLSRIKGEKGEKGDQGEKGENGNNGTTTFESTVFKRTDYDVESVNKPTGGSFSNPVPSGWEDGIPQQLSEKATKVWMSKRTFTSPQDDILDKGWSDPTVMSDSTNFDVCYSSSEERPTAPATHGVQNDSIWHNEGTEDDIWMATSSRKANSTEWSNWSITKIKGEDGEPGNDGLSRFTSTVFYRGDNKPSTPITGSYSSPIPNGWSDGIPAYTNGASTRVWMSKRVFTDPETETYWSEPCVIEDTTEFDVCYSADENYGLLPDQGSNLEINGWHNTGKSDDIWMATAKKESLGSWSDWSVTRIKGEKGDKGDKGNDGTSAIIADLDNEMDTVVTDSNGNFTGTISLYSTVSLYYGINKIKITQVDFSNVPNGIQILSPIQTGFDMKCTFNVSQFSGDKANIIMTLHGEGIEETRNLTFTIAKSKTGIPGQAAVVYRLLPSASIIKISDTGIITPSRLTCNVIKVDGESSTPISADQYPTGWRLKKGYSGVYPIYSDSDSDYGFGFTELSDSYTSFDFYLMDESGNIIDKETIPTVRDGNSAAVDPTLSGTYYLVDTQGLIAPTSGWGAKGVYPSNVQNGQYVWSKTIIHYTDGNEIITHSASRYGIDGQGIINTDTKYSLQNNNTTPIDSNTIIWQDNYPTSPEEDQWIYIKTISTFANGEKSISYNMTQVGAGSYYAGIEEYYGVFTSSGPSSTSYPAVRKWTKNENVYGAITADWQEGSTPDYDVTNGLIYLWNFEISHDSDGNHYVTAPILIANLTKSISSKQELYGVNNTAVLPPDPSTMAVYYKKGSNYVSGWEDESYECAPTDTYPYQWNKTIVKYTDGSADDVSYHISARIGTHGTNVSAQYSSDKTSWHSSFIAGDQWMRTSTDGTNWSQAMKIVGEDGDQTRYYFGISADYTTTSVYTAPTLKSGTTWSDDPVATDSSNPYLWMKIQPMTAQRDAEQNVSYVVNGSATYIRMNGEKGDSVTLVGDEWYLGGQPTGIKATPDDPDTWTIGSDGYWYFNGNRTESKAIGSNGQSVYVSLMFKRSSSAPTDILTTEGDYNHPSPSNSVGWSDGIPSGSDPIYMQLRVFTSDGESPQQSTWGPACLMVDTADIDIEYSAVETPGNPTNNPTNWHNSATSSDIWMAIRSKTGGSWSNWQITKIKGEKGNPGADSFIIDIDNEMTSIPVDSTGKVTSQILLSFGLKVWLGTTDKTSECTITTSTLPTGFSVNTDNKSNPIITIAAETVPTEITEITFTATHTTYGSRSAVFSIAAVKSGGKGQDAIIRELFPSASSISVSTQSNGTYSPSTYTLTCGYKKVVGNQSPTVIENATGAIDGYNIYYRLYNRTSGWGRYTLYVGNWSSSFNVNSNSKVEFILCTNTDNTINDSSYITGLIDKETIPVIADGKQGDPGDPGDPGQPGVSGLIEKVIEYYQATGERTPNTFTAENIANWSLTVPSNFDSSKPYLWNAEYIIYSDNRVAYSTPELISTYNDVSAKLEIKYDSDEGNFKVNHKLIKDGVITSRTIKSNIDFDTDKKDVVVLQASTKSYDLLPVLDINQFNYSSSSSTQKWIGKGIYKYSSYSSNSQSMNDWNLLIASPDKGLIQNSKGNAVWNIYLTRDDFEELSTIAATNTSNTSRVISIFEDIQLIPDIKLYKPVLKGITEYYKYSDSKTTAPIGLNDKGIPTTGWSTSVPTTAGKYLWNVSVIDWGVLGKEASTPECLNNYYEEQSIPYPTNLLLDGNNFSDYEDQNGLAEIKTNLINSTLKTGKATVYYTDFDRNDQYIEIYLELDTKYSIKNKSCIFSCYFYNPDEGIIEVYYNNQKLNTDTSNNRLYCKFTGGDCNTVTIKLSGQGEIDFTFANAQVEISSASTPSNWCKGTNESIDYIGNVMTQGSTDIEGGLVLSNILALKDEQDNISAGLSGLNNDKILLWGGGTYTQAVNAANNSYYKSGTSGDKIPVLIKMDGTGSLANGNINWTSSKTNIGGFTLTSTALTAGSGFNSIGMSTGNYAFYAGNSIAASAPFRVTKAGLFTANAGNIGGWTINSDNICSTKEKKTIKKCSDSASTTIDANYIKLEKDGTITSVSANSRKVGSSSSGGLSQGIGASNPSAYSDLIIKPGEISMTYDGTVVKSGLTMCVSSKIVLDSFGIRYYTDGSDEPDKDFSWKDVIDALDTLINSDE